MNAPCKTCHTPSKCGWRGFCLNRASGPEGRAEAQSSDTATRDHSNETVSSRAESEPAVSVAPPLTPND